MSTRDDPVVVEFELDRDENIRALRWHLLRSGGLPWAAPVGAAGSVLLGAALYQNGWAWTTALAAGSTVLPVVAALAVFAVPRLAVGRSPALTEPHRLQFSDDQIDLNTPNREGTLSWSRYSRWAKTDEFIVLYYASDQFTLIPRRVLANGEERRLVELLERHVGPEG